MPCYYPLTAWKSVERHERTGKHLLTFNPHKALVQGTALRLPCGQCIGCRLKRSEQWGMRCMHEAKMHDQNCMVTLTFDDEHVRASHSLFKGNDDEPGDFSKFIQDLRNYARRKAGGRKIRYAGNGEYGDVGGRPHHHGLLFGWDFPDKRYYMTRKGNPVFKSELLDSLWGKGMCEIGSVTHKSAAYIARYCLKKITGERAEAHYFRQSPIDGGWYQVEPEFFVTSRRPGIGSTWFDKFASDCFPSDFLVVDGRKVPVPAYYLGKLDELGQVPVKRARKRKAIQPAQRWNNTPERLAVREEVRKAKLKTLTRSL